MAHVEIKNHGTSTKLYVDGIDVSGITSSFSLSQDACGTPVLNLKIVGAEVSVDAEAYPKFPERIRRFIEEWNEKHSPAPADTGTGI